MPEGPMGPVAVVVDQVVLQHAAQVSVVDDQDPAEQLAAERADHPRTDRVGAGALVAVS